MISSLPWPIVLSLLLSPMLGSFASYMVLAKKRGTIVSDQPPLTAEAVEVFVASLRQRSAPVNQGFTPESCRRI